MQPEERDAAHLWDMLLAARDALGFVTGKTLATFSADRMAKAATERALMIVGEAAGRVSPAFRESHPEIPWRRIVGLRNVLAHEYGQVVVERIWTLMEGDLPRLAAALERLVPKPPEPDR
jgi:uncharacterized protein with HEPN domain